MSVSNQALHDSHSVHWRTKEETWACLRCGSVAQRKAVNLSRPCCPGLGGERLCKRLGGWTTQHTAASLLDEHQEATDAPYSARASKQAKHRQGLKWNPVQTDLLRSRQSHRIQAATPRTEEESHWASRALPGHWKFA